MRPKPKHLGPEYAAQFQDAAVVAAYPARPPYPAEVFEILTNLITRDPQAVLDVGCGTGDLARRLAPQVARVDAVDISWRMVERGKSLPGGDALNLHWIVGRAEDAPLHPPYALITAGESLHWMDWPVVMPRLRAALAPGALLAIVGRSEESSPWRDELVRLIVRHTTNRDFQPYDLTAELVSRNLFTQVGERNSVPIPFEQTVDDYIESIHSRNGFSRERMRPEDAAAFDADVRALVSPYARESDAGNVLHLEIRATVTWGLPQLGDMPAQRLAAREHVE